MADVFEEYSKLEEAYSGDAWSLLRSPFSRLYVSMLNALFPDRSKPVRTETLYLAVDSMLQDLEEAGFDIPQRGGRRITGRELCSESWMTDLRLVEKFVLDDGDTEFRLRSTTIAALDAVDRMGTRDVLLSSPRIETIAREISKLAALVSGDFHERRSQLVKDLEDAKAALDLFDKNGGAVELSSDEVRARLINIVDLLQQVPSDMRQIEEQLGRERDDLVDQFRADERPHGDVIAEYLQRSDTLFNGTDSGRLYNGAIAMFADGQFDADMHNKVRSIATSKHVKGSDTAKKYSIKSSWESVSDGMTGIFELRSKCSRTISNAIGSYDMSRYRELNRELKRLDSLMWARAMKSSGREKSLMPNLLPDCSIEPLQRRLKGPDEHVPPPPLEQGDDEDVVIDIERLRMLGGPFTQQVVEGFEAQLEPGQSAPASALFGQLADCMRRDVEVLGLIHYAVENGLMEPGSRADEYCCVGHDGVRRTWMAPRILISKSPSEFKGAEHG